MKFFIIAIFITNLFGGIYDNLAKNSLKFIKPNIIFSEKPAEKPMKTPLK